MGKRWPTMKEKIKHWKEHRIARFKTSGCALCLHICQHEEKFRP